MQFLNGYFKNLVLKNLNNKTYQLKQFGFDFFEPKRIVSLQQILIHIIWR